MVGSFSLGVFLFEIGCLSKRAALTEPEIIDLTQESLGKTILVMKENRVDFLPSISIIHDILSRRHLLILIYMTFKATWTCLAALELP